ncbi:MAG: cbb3-type cytochrome c oxidase subunit 3 [Phycisphaerales bacterium]|nr:cbb3-type cytochrome c oxidase subunit 3 [Phycisphaerae bacterium]NNF41529.1 cbb3-type cytochrome c oxidase subunit 3 [Phycisphaerales bacterium]NNM26634.1 cbb3-type cytochrome c oxidase subunit 3 [Phycisphaerales bacterium]
MTTAIAPETVNLLKGIALFVFIAIFLGVVLRLLMRRREHDRRMARLPLDDTPTHRRRAERREDQS